MSPVEAYIIDLPENQRELMWQLHGLFMEVPEVTAKLRYKIPFYYRKSWLCYLNPKGKEAIELVFLYGQQLSDPDGILDARGRKQVAGIYLDDLEAVPLEAISSLFQESILLE